MKGIDTNVLARYLVQDEPAQSRLASQFVEKVSREGDTIFINLVVLCELVWVLQGAFKVEKEVLVDTLSKILIAKEFNVESPDIAKKALELFRTASVDFSDALIAAKNTALGCKKTVTFDQKAAKKLNAFELLV